MMTTSTTTTATTEIYLLVLLMTAAEQLQQMIATRERWENNYRVNMNTNRLLMMQLSIHLRNK